MMVFVLKGKDALILSTGRCRMGDIWNAYREPNPPKRISRFPPIDRDTAGRLWTTARRVSIDRIQTIGFAVGHSQKELEEMGIGQARAPLSWSTKRTLATSGRRCGEEFGRWVIFLELQGYSSVVALQVRPWESSDGRPSPFQTGRDAIDLDLVRLPSILLFTPSRLRFLFVLQYTREGR